MVDKTTLGFGIVKTLNEIKEFMLDSESTQELSQILETTSSERTQRGGTPASMRGRVRNDDRSIIARFF